MNITILNILDTSSEDLAQWVSTDLLNVQLPVFGLNHTINVKSDVLPLLPIISNRIMFATSLYSMCVGAKANATNAKKTGDAAEKAEAANKITSLTANIDILYRSIQSLESMRESASRVMTGMLKDYAQI